ncbi:MAG: hypothetical protein DIZ80_11300 [endosymbiont of Galathealinum brachiosum]|uniref:Methyl-accepting chemotaxis protein n=1 Tax=endosymbiont of Galathealinum brachiosum TaxID=2200906 RepID=A0A370DE52_9GAMM|nr:MAG: hypothetical protein DIZ80_11300 [endosymbiont of Galathealinum brachiosum]
MRKLTLKLQVWLGFGLMLALTAIIAFTSIFFLVQVNKGTDYIASKAQPTMVEALKITASLNNTARIINAYMITHKSNDRKDLASSLETLEKHLDTFSHLGNVSENNSLTSSINEIHTLVGDFNEYIIEIEYLIENPVDNYPALALSNTKINPLNQSILSSLDQAIISELEEGNTQQRKKLLIAISDIRHNWMNIVASNRAFLANPSDTREKQTRVYRDNHVTLLNALQKKSNLYTFEQEEAIDSVASDSKRHLKLLDQVYKIFKSGDWRADQLLLSNQIEPLINQISGKLTEISNAQLEGTSNASEDLLGKIDTAIFISITAMIIAIIIGVGIAWSSAKQINTIVTEVSSSLEQMSQGNFNINLNENQAGEAGQIAVVLNYFSNQLKDMINNLTNSVGQLEHASASMTSIISESSDNILQQHRETEMVATAVEEMTATAQEVATSAATAATSAKQANDLAGSGALVSTEALGGIEHLVNDLDKASKVIQNLKNESNNISVVLDVIRDISDQTNLLALNAAIEAARAGEQGRGFAVVADEVRTLASKTQESTNEIRSKIDQLQNGANDAVEAMDNAIKEVTINSDQVEKVAESLGEIAGEIQTINGQLDQMAAASEQQSATSEEISRNIISISTLAEKSAQGTSQVRSAEDELAMATQSIQSVISDFNT